MHLHSTIFILKPIDFIMTIVYIANLHSTIFILKLLSRRMMFLKE